MFHGKYFNEAVVKWRFLFDKKMAGGFDQCDCCCIDIRIAVIFFSGCTRIVEPELWHLAIFAGTIETNGSDCTLFEKTRWFTIQCIHKNDINFINWISPDSSSPA